MKWNECIRAKMRQMKIGQEEVAEHMGVTPGTISHWLNLTREPKLEEIKRLARFLQIDFGAMMVEDARTTDYGLLTDNNILHFGNKSVKENNFPYAKHVPLPVIIFKAGEFMETGELFLVADSDCKSGDKIYIMPDGSMLPDIQPGARLLIRRGVVPIYGEHYLGLSEHGPVVGTYDTFGGENFLINSIRRIPVSLIYGHVVDGWNRITKLKN